MFRETLVRHFDVFRLLSHICYHNRVLPNYNRMRVFLEQIVYYILFKYQDLHFLRIRII